MNLLMTESEKEMGPGSLELELRLQTEVAVWWNKTTHLLKAYEL